MNHQPYMRSGLSNGKKTLLHHSYPTLQAPSRSKIGRHQDACPPFAEVSECLTLAKHEIRDVREAMDYMEQENEKRICFYNSGRIVGMKRMEHLHGLKSRSGQATQTICNVQTC